jgi:hypothetical protein
MEASLGFAIPEEYRRYLEWSDGGFGTLGERHLRLLSCEELVDYNRRYTIAEILPGYLCIGTDGGDGFLLVKVETDSDERVFSMSGLLDEDELEVAGANFEDFIHRYPSHQW